jgi:hypothetical protein
MGNAFGSRAARKFERLLLTIPEICGRYFPCDRNDFVDSTGCQLAENHDGAHRCIDKHGNTVEWEFDFDCGCEDCRTDNINDMCIIWRTIE